MTVVLGAWIGGIACVVMLFALAIISQLVNSEPTEFVYLVGIVLAIAAWVLLSKAGF